MGKSTYTPEIADEICARIAVGETLRQICREPGKPHWTTVYDWIKEREDFALRFAHARDLGADAIAEDIIDIIDDGRNDWMEKLDRDDKPIGYQLNGEHVQRSKLRAEMRLKLLAKWNPKKYGEKTSMELTGANGGPVQISDTERAAKVAAILAAAQARRAADKADVDDLV